MIDWRGQIFTEYYSAIRERGTGTLLVEHDMSLVVSVCATLYALDFGRVIFHGQPGEAMTSDVLGDAHLGTAAAR